MPRLRRAPGGYVYHALNRAVARVSLFDKDGDFDALNAATRPSYLAAETPSAVSFHPDRPRLPKSDCPVK